METKHYIVSFEKSGGEGKLRIGVYRAILQGISQRLAPTPPALQP